MTKSNWKKCKLSDIADVRDGTHDSPKEVIEGGFPLVTSRHISNGKVDLTNTYNISVNDYNMINLRSKVDCGDILISMIGTVGQVAYVDETPEYAIKNIGLIKPSILVSSKYIFYYLKSPIAQENIIERLRGTTQQYLSLGELRNFPIDLPPLEEQKRIAEVLGAFDDKIELLQKQNKTLEEMAKAIFKSWFVDFDIVKAKQKGEKKEDIIKNYHLTEELYNLFPSSFVDSSLGPIPLGWKVKELDSLCNIFTGKKDVNKTIKNGPYIFFSCSPKTFCSNEYLYDGQAVIIAGNGSFTGRVSFYDGKFDLYQRTYAVTSKTNKRMLYLYQIMKYFFEPKYMGGTRGSSIPYIVKGDLTKFKFVFSQVIIEQYEDIISPLFNKLQNNNKQIQTLTELRDTLLPRLISGKIRV